MVIVPALLMDVDHEEKVLAAGFLQCEVVTSVVGYSGPSRHSIPHTVSRAGHSVMPVIGTAYANT